MKKKLRLLYLLLALMFFGTSVTPYTACARELPGAAKDAQYNTGGRTTGIGENGSDDSSEERIAARAAAKSISVKTVSEPFRLSAEGSAEVSGDEL